MSMLLMGCGSGGGFNPLSLNPTLLALPENSFSRTGGQFTAASSQYLSAAHTDTLKAGDINYWGSVWVNPTTLGAQNTIWSRWTITENVVLLRSYETVFFIRTDSFPFVNTSALTIGVWTFLFWYHDPDLNQIGLFVNGNHFSNTYAGTPMSFNQTTYIGCQGGSLYFDGKMDNMLFGKAPSSMGNGGVGSLAHTIATTLYNSGNGLPFQSITAQQESDWGIVSGWLDNSLTADAFGSNTLTNNNGVTQAAGKVNAVAVDNDPVYFVNDASSSDNDLTQVTLASRPLYDVDAFGSGKHGWLGTNAGHQHFPWSKVLPTKYSISVWLKPNFNHDSASTTYNIWVPNTQQQYLRYEGRAIWGANDQFGVTLNGSTYDLKVPFFTFSSGDLIHLAVTIDRDTNDYRIYKNGSLADTYNSTPGTLTATTTIFIGSWTSAGNGWEGWMGPVLYTDDILTASEILSLYNHGPQ